MRGAFDLGSRRYFELSEVPVVFAPPDKALRLLILADDLHPANVVQDHIRSFSEFSTHRVSVVNTRSVKRPDPDAVSDFDALLIHYSIFVIAETYLSVAWQEFISTFPGPVAVIHEDEYQRINAFTQKFAELGVQAVFSCLDSKDTLERVYGKSALPRDTFFFSCLPGYVSPQLFATSPPPISGRPFDIVYRGRTLRPELGRFAQEKRLIGEQVLAAAAGIGLACDISSAEEDRIYGSKWPQFLMSGKAMLGVEGGASIFDFDGTISEAVAAYLQAHPCAEFDDIWTNVLAKDEGNIVFRTITPKFFEAIAAKTALVLYPGKYSNVLIPDRHFIPLERDGSNMADVVAKLKDHCYLQAMVDQTYEEILLKVELGTQFYVNQIDRVLSALADHTPTSKLLRLSIAGRAFQYRLQEQLASTQEQLASTQEQLDFVRMSLNEVHQKVSSEAHLAELAMKIAPLKIQALMDVSKMNLLNSFDAVVMLTWSDWDAEPRSNRYHFASRFARNLPVLFLQHRYTVRNGIQVVPSELEGLDIVNVSLELNDDDVRDLLRLFSSRGIKRPLLWIYDSLHYQKLIDSMPKAFLSYHATENYLIDSVAWSQGISTIVSSIKKLMPQVDFAVFVSQGVEDSFRKSAGYRGPGIVIENGCDAEYFLDRKQKYWIDASSMQRHTAIFQGGINTRLDYELLYELITSMADWDFLFCGAAIASAGWSRLLREKNVRYVGAVAPEEFTRLMYQSTVGIIPFIQDPWIYASFPLKAYEYVACGLPVVTVPIHALEHDSELVTTACSSKEFESAIRNSVSSRDNPVFLQKRRLSALANSYDIRFEKMKHSLVNAKSALVGSGGKLRIAMLYDGMSSMHVSTIREHLEAFDKYSRHDITYLPSSPSYWNRAANEFSDLVDFSIFDVAVIHYSTRLSISSHLEEGLARAFENFCGYKILFIQDEYEGTEIARSWMDRLQFDLVYTCVPPLGLNYVYPAYRFPGTEFLPTLTGYVPEDPALEQYAMPLEERKFHIAYRGRKLPAVYGKLGQEKYEIGVRVKALASARGLPIDIEVDDAKRIYGTEWYRFLGSARATLGTESGANVFDFDGTLRKAIEKMERENPGVTFEEISERIISPHEGHVHMNQISPKIFEAIRLRTALVLFNGEYSGVVRANEHYIPLEKDYSNIEEVFTKLEDIEYLRSMTNRAYVDIVGSGMFSYRTFIQGVDADLNARVLKSVSKRIQLIKGPLFTIDSDGLLKPALPALPPGLISGPHPLGRPVSMVELVSGTYLVGGKMSNIKLPDYQSALLPESEVPHFRKIKSKFRVHVLRPLLSRFQRALRGRTVFSDAVRFVWKRVPYSIQVRIRTIVTRY